MNLARQWHDHSTEAVSNVEPNTVEPNSEDKTNHPTSGNICKSWKIHQVNVARRLKASRATAVRHGKACRAK